MRKPSELKIRLFIIVSALICAASGIARAQAAEPIRDNSFLIEEAFNQPRGVVQHVGTVNALARGGLTLLFTEEWPLGGMRHQIAYSIPVVQAGVGGRTGLGDVGFHYRHQTMGLGGGPVYVAPRVSMLVATGDAALGMGAGGTTFQTLLPVSVELTRLTFNGNVGLSLTPRAKDGFGNAARTLESMGGLSAIWAASREVNVLLETVWTQHESVIGPATVARERELLISPGVRWAHDLPGDLQIVRGLAVTLGVGPSRGRNAVFAYLSIEHPFSR